MVKVKDVADITKLKKTVEDYLRKLNLRKSGNA